MARRRVFVGRIFLFDAVVQNQGGDDFVFFVIGKHHGAAFQGHQIDRDAHGGLDVAH